MVSLGERSESPRKLAVQCPLADKFLIGLHLPTVAVPYPAGTFYFDKIALIYVDGDASSRTAALLTILPDGRRCVAVYTMHCGPVTQSQVELFALFHGILLAYHLRSMGVWALVLGDNTSAQDCTHKFTVCVSIPKRLGLMRWFLHQSIGLQPIAVGDPVLFAKAPGGPGNPADKFARDPQLAEQPLSPLPASQCLQWSVPPHTLELEAAQPPHPHPSYFPLSLLWVYPGGPLDGTAVPCWSWPPLPFLSHPSIVLQ